LVPEAPPPPPPPPTSSTMIFVVLLAVVKDVPVVRYVSLSRTRLGK
jgi:hypothetical protein